LGAWTGRHGGPSPAQRLGGDAGSRWSARRRWLAVPGVLARAIRKRLQGQVVPE
jgi:hypothetical protein